MHQYVDVVTAPASVMYCYYWSGHSVILGNAQPLNDFPCIDLCDDVITLFSKPATMPCMMDPRLYLLCCKILELSCTSKHFHRTVYSIPENGFDVEL